MQRKNSGRPGIFSGLSELIEKLSELAESGQQLSQTGEIREGEKLQGIYGFTVKVGLGDRETTIEPFGNIGKDRRSGKPVIQEVREPAVDVFEEEKHVVVVAELPGISMENVKLQLEGERLTIVAERRGKKYRKEVELPQAFTTEQMQATCNNGVLEVKLAR